MKNITFNDVIGHDAEKEEIIRVIDWFNHSKEIEAKGLEIPHGILLYGRPGNGKTMLLKAIINSVKAQVFIYDDSISSVSESLRTTFQKAKDCGHAIIVIDELDLLIEKDHLALRILQEFMDGLSSDNDFLLIGACNETRCLGQALLRPGRFGKPILIPNLLGHQIFKLFMSFMEEYKINVSGDLDEDYIVAALEGQSCASVKSIVNDIALRHGFENINDEIIFETIYNFRNRCSKIETNKNVYTAIHEAGHAVMINRYQNNFKFNALQILKDGGATKYSLKQDVIYTYDVIIQQIDIALSGMIATKLLYGLGDAGSQLDLEQAKMSAAMLINSCGYRGADKTITMIGPDKVDDSEQRLAENEHLIERILKKEERLTKKYLKKHIDQVKILGNALLKKGHLSVKEIDKILNN